MMWFRFWRKDRQSGQRMEGLDRCYLLLHSTDRAEEIPLWDFFNGKQDRLFQEKIESNPELFVFGVQGKTTKSHYFYHSIKDLLDGEWDRIHSGAVGLCDRAYILCFNGRPEKALAYIHAGRMHELIRCAISIDDLLERDDALTVLRTKLVDQSQELGVLFKHQVRRFCPTR